MSNFEGLGSLKVVHCDDNPFELDRFRDAVNASKVGKTFKIRQASSKGELEFILTEDVNVDVIVLDIDLGQGEESGVSLIRWCQTLAPQAVVIMQSSFDDAETTIECLANGADDFISKNYDRQELGLRIVQSWRLGRLKRGISTSDHPLGAAKIKATSATEVSGSTMRQVANRVPLILKSAISAVHIYGESGTGKEVVADILANALPAGTPFIRVNCAAIAPSLLFSELFGHTKGAFTGASQDKQGLIEAANHGWIFLDEVSNLSQDAQGALLRVLENREVRRLGANNTRKINVNVLSAANESLSDLVAQGRFRKDLWQRLCEATIELPPLRERPGEIEDLIEFFCKTMKGGPYKISKPALDVLCLASWDEGNVRELRNCLRAMTEYQVNQLLTPLAIPAKVWEQSAEARPSDLASEIDDQLPKSKPSENQVLTIHLPEANAAIDFDTLTDQLLLEVTKAEYRRAGKQSLRSMSKNINMSRSTLSSRLRGLVQRGVIGFDELAKMVGLSEPPGTSKSKTEGSSS